jgi:hypothetical protein
LNEILAYIDNEIVPTDLIVNTRLSIFDAKAGMSLSGPTIEILGIGEEEAAGDIVLSSAGMYFISTNNPI